jgi:predicted dienelactone hydrolase
MPCYLVAVAAWLVWIANGARPAVSLEEISLAAAKPGPYAVETLLDDWVDPARDRQIPVKIYYPISGSGPFPVILFSHGLGSTRLRYEYLGRHWASHGFVSVHPQHKGSDDEIWKGTLFVRRAFIRAANDPQTALDRLPDLHFVLDRLEKLDREPSVLHGRLDLERVGASGHSYGGFATLAVLGQRFLDDDGEEIAFTDSRIKAAVVMSPSVPPRPARAENSFSKIKVPCLHMTGTEDVSPLGITTKQDRRAAYDEVEQADQYLITFQGGDHAIFTDQERPLGNGDKDELFRRLIQASSTMFWKAYLTGDARSKQWLTGGGLQSLLANNGVLEVKRAAGAH